ncbi:histidine triad nucleotide-binding protein [Christensenellaceae bacterium OttesenSCG-928-L17]|nr:histidine triad nucleotide-binding protein [Christensenellaceae bacterium OttesenSCG-928-L17]
MENCIFCKIARGEIPSNKAYEDEQVLAFYDLSPQAPVHVLIVPKKHVESVLGLTDEDDALRAHMLRVAKELANTLGVAENGFRLVFNTGVDGGQTVMHLHMHLLAGRALGWPPG